jgi:hypothetical protein
MYGMYGMVLVWYWYGTGMVLVWYWYGTGMYGIRCGIGMHTLISSKIQ